MTNAVNIAQGGSNNVTFRNRIINGGMVIDQRNAGASVTATTTTTYSVDRWKVFGSQNSKFTIQQSSTAPSGFINSVVITSSSAYAVQTGEQFWVRQDIEGFNVADLGWGTANAKTVTLSFQVYSSLTGTFGGSFRNDNADRSYPFSYTISSANTWTSISVTVAGDTNGTWLKNNGAGISLFFGLGVASNLSNTAGAWASGNYVSATGATSVVGTNGATFYITGVQLEAGTTASPFEYRQYGTELALCQRYYAVIKDPVCRGVGTGGTAGGASRLSVIYPTTMRAAPSITSTGTFNFWNGASSTTGSTIAGTFGGVSLNQSDIDINIGSAFSVGQAVCMYAAGGSQSLFLNSEL
jgi:hypothetical protein